MMALLGLTDDYAYDGNIITQAFANNALPSALHDPNQLSEFNSLVQMYDQINAPTGQFGISTLTISTHALASNTPGDATYTSLEAQLSSMATQRNAIASQMNAILQSAAVGNGHHFDNGQANSLIAQGQSLLNQAKRAGRPSGLAAQSGWRLRSHRDESRDGHHQHRNQGDNCAERNLLAFPR